MGVILAYADFHSKAVVGINLVSVISVEYGIYIWSIEKKSYERLKKGTFLPQ